MLGRIANVHVADEHDAEDHDRQPLDEDPTDRLLLQAAEIDLQEDLVRQRAEGISSIHKDVTKVNQLFQDMAFHVTRQGDMLDNIESNVNSASSQTGNATRELLIADTHHRNRKPSLVCFMFTLILFLIGLAMLKHLFDPLYVKVFTRFNFPIIHSINTYIELLD